MRIRNFIIGSVAALLAMAIFAITSVAEADNFKPGDTGVSPLVCTDLDDARELISLMNAGREAEADRKIMGDEDFKCFYSAKEKYGFIVVEKVETLGSWEIYETINPLNPTERGYMFSKIAEPGTQI